MKRLSLLFVNIFISILLIFPVQAAVITESTIDWSRKGQFYIKYEDTVEGVDPVINAEFTLYKIATITESGGYHSIIPGIEQITKDIDAQAILSEVKKAYQTPQEGYQKYATKTMTTGECTIQDVELGLYLVEETTPAIEHFVSIPFLASFPYTENNIWWYDVYAEPKAVPGGDLIVEKVVSGRGGEQNRDFHFKIDLFDYDEPIHFQKSDGSSGKIVSGDTVTLKHNEKITFDTIPVGLKYQVFEIEDGKDGYVTTSKGTIGNIQRTVPSIAHFLNTNNPTPATGDSYLFLLMGGVVLICLVAILILLIVLKKRKNR